MHYHNRKLNHRSFKASETLLGIETENPLLCLLHEFGFKASETLLGIETTFLQSIS